MTQEQIKDRIAKKEQEIAKIEKRIKKWQDAQCEKAFVKDMGWLFNMGRDREDLWNHYIKKCNDEIDYAVNDLHDAQVTLEKYNQQLVVAQDKENTLNELPEVLVEFKNWIVSCWDRYDLDRKEEIYKKYKDFYYVNGTSYNRHTLEETNEFWRTMNHKYGHGWHNDMTTSQEDIHKANVKAAESLILNLINRTIEITGKITDARGLYLDNDNNGFTIINGFIVGEKGKARVESILAGGYNIQRLHVRVLVKPAK